jgi:alpha-ketoglutarate-dependent 2,4-dichlorophenoxyacetate dioxygenase
MHRARRYRDPQEARDLRGTSIKGTGLTAEQIPAMAAE